MENHELWMQTGMGSSVNPATHWKPLRSSVPVPGDEEVSLKWVPELALRNCWLTAWPSLNAQKMFVNTLWASSDRKPCWPSHSWVS